MRHIQRRCFRGSIFSRRQTIVKSSWRHPPILMERRLYVNKRRYPSGEQSRPGTEKRSAYGWWVQEGLTSIDTYHYIFHIRIFVSSRQKARKQLRLQIHRSLQRDRPQRGRTPCRDPGAGSAQSSEGFFAEEEEQTRFRGWCPSADCTKTVG